MVRILISMVAFFALNYRGLSGESKPNIVFFFADDMGYADLSCYGAPDVKTPRIDGLAREGVRFTNVYAMGPECTPSRTSILTGRYPQRVGGLECAIGTGNVGRYDDAVRLSNQHDLGLPPVLATLAPGLKKSGYYNGIFGKWHLGYETKFSPLDQGFDQFIGFLGGNVEYFRHVELSDLPVYVSGRKPIQRKGYLTDLITKDALRFLDERAKNRDRPFFLYLPHAAPHFPFQGPDDDTGRLPTAEEWDRGKRANYIKMIERLDQGVGDVLDSLSDHGFGQNTIVVFASDHGAKQPGLNTPFRDFKGTLFEGGIRVPLIIRWPGKIEPGTVSQQVGSLMDLTKSFLAAAGAEAPRQKLDGDDLIAHVVDGKPDYPRTLYWRSRRGNRTWWAIRDGDWKYVRRNDDGNVDEWFFNLKSDPGESHNILETDPASAEAEKLRGKILRWETEVNPAPRSASD